MISPIYIKTWVYSHFVIHHYHAYDYHHCHTIKREACRHQKVFSFPPPVPQIPTKDSERRRKWAHHARYVQSLHLYCQYSIGWAYSSCCSNSSTTFQNPNIPGRVHSTSLKAKTAFMGQSESTGDPRTTQRDFLPQHSTKMMPLAWRPMQYLKCHAMSSRLPSPPRQSSKA
jgi:hypothetical protein